MPLYSFLCKECSERFDLLIGVTSDKGELRCPQCGSNHIKKTFSTFGISGSEKGTSSCSTCSSRSCSTCQR